MHETALKAPLFKKLFIFLSLRQHFGRVCGQTSGTPGPWEVQMEVVVIALTQKVVEKFLKVCVEGEGLTRAPCHSILQELSFLRR